MTPRLTGATMIKPMIRPSGIKLLPQTQASLVSNPSRHFHATSTDGSTRPIASAMQTRMRSDRRGALDVIVCACDPVDVT